MVFVMFGIIIGLGVAYGRFANKHFDEPRYHGVHERYNPFTSF